MYTWTFRGCVFFCRLAKQHKFQSFAVKNAVSFQKCRFDVFTEVTKLAVGKSPRLVGESRRLVGKSRRFKTLTYHRKHVNAKSASVQNSWRLLEKAVLIEKAENMHTYEDPGIRTGYCRAIETDVNIPAQPPQPAAPPVWH